MTTDLQRGIVTPKQTRELLDIVGDLVEAPTRDITFDHLQHRAARFFDAPCPVFMCKHCAEQWAEDAEDLAETYAGVSR